MKVSEAKATTASTGTEMISVTFEVTEGKFKNRKLWHNFSLTPKSLVFLYNFMKAGGSTLLDSEDVETSEIVAAMMKMTITAHVTPGMTNNGNPRNDLGKFQAIDGAKTAATTAVANAPETAPQTAGALFD